MGPGLAKLKRIFREREFIRILLIGMDVAVKNQVLIELHSRQKNVKAVPDSYNWRVFRFKNTDFMVWAADDVEESDPFWKWYLKGTAGIIFLVDAADRERIDEARAELSRVLADKELQDPCLIIVIEHHDGPNVMSDEEITTALDLSKSENRNWEIQHTVAGTGHNLDPWLHSLISQVGRAKATRK